MQLFYFTDLINLPQSSNFYNFVELNQFWDTAVTLHYYSNTFVTLNVAKVRHHREYFLAPKYDEICTLRSFLFSLSFFFSSTLNISAGCVSWRNWESYHPAGRLYDGRSCPSTSP